MKADDFVSAIGPAAQASAKATGIPASFVVAEGALESGWGVSALARQGMNLFGVKADRSWSGNVLSMQTREFLHGKWTVVPALWRKYDTWEACIADHAKFLTENPRYAPAFAHKDDGEAFARAVAAAGYATDPDYLTKILTIMRVHDLKALDSQPA